MYLFHDRLQFNNEKEVYLSFVKIPGKYCFSFIHNLLPWKQNDSWVYIVLLFLLEENKTIHFLLYVFHDWWATNVLALFLWLCQLVGQFMFFFSKLWLIYCLWVKVKYWFTEQNKIYFVYTWTQSHWIT